MGIIKEFKAFAVRGNVIDMAVGIVIGMAFGKIITSIVNDIILPPIGMLIAGVKFSQLKVTLSDAVMNDAGEVVKQAVTINYGNFIQVSLEFILIAFVIFLVIKGLANMKKKEAEEEPEAEPSPVPTKEEQLLTEIRDLLKKD